MKKIITKNAPLFATAVLALSTLFTASHADSALTVPPLEIKLKVDVSQDTFYVQPTSKVDITQAIGMNYNPVDKKLDDLKIEVKYLNSAGSINAKLFENAELRVVGEGEAKKLPLKVFFDKTEITTTSKPITTQEKAKKQQTGDIVIKRAAENGATAIPSGLYEGTVTIIFESAA